MNPSFQRSLFIFRRDLRLQDNTALISALKESKEVIACFIFTPTQIKSNPYLGTPSLQFLIESLEDLEKQLENAGGKLYLFYQEPKDVIETCIKNRLIDAVFINSDYTPYSVQRDAKIKKLCETQNISFKSFDDILLNPPEMTLKSDGKPYSIFTPFHRNALKFDVEKPSTNRYSNYYKESIDFAASNEIYSKILPSRKLPCLGGRSKALSILKHLSPFASYESLRDFPERNATTHLSAHLKFTTVSPREVYHAILKELGPSSDLLRSLYWRDFFTSIAFYFPYVFKGAFHEKFNNLSWSYDEAAFEKWCGGKTGFPIVDAGMRELNETGFMHNRLRMIVASFLVKDLHIDWRWGEKYFATHLSDYDPALNNGNWQWAASTGCDAQPYFRIFNPWTQGLKFDAECIYIKKWVPELEDLSPKEIHNWHKKEVRRVSIPYPAPMVDHSIESKKTLELYKECSP